MCWDCLGAGPYGHRQRPVKGSESGSHSKLKTLSHFERVWRCARRALPQGGQPGGNAKAGGLPQACVINYYLRISSMMSQNVRKWPMQALLGCSMMRVQRAWQAQE